MPKPIYVAGDVPPPEEWNEWLVGGVSAWLTADVSVVSSTTLIDGMTVPVTASAVYLVRAMVLYDAATASDILIGWTGPAGATLRWTASGLQQAAASTSDDRVAAAGAISATAAFGGQGAGTTCGLLLDGLLTTSATAGTLALQFAQAVSGATATKMLTGSWLHLWRVS